MKSLFDFLQPLYFSGAEMGKKERGVAMVVQKQHEVCASWGGSVPEQ